MVDESSSSESSSRKKDNAAVPVQEIVAAVSAQESFVAGISGQENINAAVPAQEIIVSTEPTQEITDAAEPSQEIIDAALPAQEIIVTAVSALESFVAAVQTQENIVTAVPAQEIIVAPVPAQGTIITAVPVQEMIVAAVPAQEMVVAAGAAKHSLEDSPASSNVEETLTELIGSFEFYQILCIFLMYITRLPVGWHTMAITILAPKQKFACADTGPPAELNDKCVDGCKHYVFDTSIFTNTIESDFQLICGRHFFKELNQLLLMLGILIGALVFGHGGDKLGRRLPIIVAGIMQLGAGVCASFSPDWYTFSFFRFLLGVSTGALMVLTFVLTMEVIGTKYREVFSIAYQIPFTFGHMAVAGYGYFLRDWHHIQLAMALPSVAFFSFICLLTESPRWLISRGKTEKAIKCITKAAKMNRRPTDNIASKVTALCEANSKDKRVRPKFTAVFLDKRLRFRTAAANFMWFSGGFGFYGVAQHVSAIGGNLFINILISGAFGGIGNVIAYCMNLTLGRKKTLIIANLVACLCCALLAVMPTKMVLTDIMLGSVGFSAFAVAFATTYIYTGELFPTTLRNSAIGVASACARIGSMCSPFVATMPIEWISGTIFAIVPLIAAIIILFLPETKWSPLPDTLDDL